MQKYYTECRSHFNSTIFGRRIEEGWCLANPVWSLILSKKIVSSCHYTHTQKGSQAIPKLLTATSSWWFWAKTTTAIFVGECHRPTKRRLKVTFLGHFQWATSSHWKKIWRNKFLKCAIVFCSNFWVMIFLPKDTHHLFGAKKKKVDLPGKIQVVINFHQLETPYNQQSSSL